MAQALLASAGSDASGQMPPPPDVLSSGMVAGVERLSGVVAEEVLGPAVPPMNSAPSHLAGFDCSWDAERQGLLVAEEVLRPAVLSPMNSPPSLVHLAGFDCSWDAERQGLLLLAPAEFGDEQSLPIQQVVERNAVHFSKSCRPCGTDLAPQSIAKPHPHGTLLHGPHVHPPSEGP